MEQFPIRITAPLAPDVTLSTIIMVPWKINLNERTLIFKGVHVFTWMFLKIGVPPKSSILIGFFIINHPFRGVPLFLETPTSMMMGTMVLIHPEFSTNLSSQACQVSGEVGQAADRLEFQCSRDVCPCVVFFFFAWLHFRTF